jgi:hypothetical protein
MKLEKELILFEHQGIITTTRDQLPICGIDCVVFALLVLFAPGYQPLLHIPVKIRGHKGCRSIDARKQGSEEHIGAESECTKGARAGNPVAGIAKTFSGELLLRIGHSNNHYEGLLFGKKFVVILKGNLEARGD